MESTLEFSQRALVGRTDYTTTKRYRSRDGRYAVVQTRSRLGLPFRWLAVRITEHGEYVISRHRNRRTAELACNRHRS